METKIDIENIIKDKKSFKDWFIKTYIREFNEIPKIKNFDIWKLKELEKESERKEIEKYLKEVLKVVSLTLFEKDLSNEVLENGKTGNVNLVRKISLYIMCDMLNFSKTLIAEKVKKDRTTVIHHCKTIGGFLQVDKTFKKKFDKILNKLEESGYLTIKNKKAENSCIEELNYHKNYIEIIFLIAHGFSNKRIAEILHLSDRTTSIHRSDIFKITGCHTSLILVSWAIEKGIKKNPELLKKFDKLLNLNANGNGNVYR
jgi:hypothetical protein